MSDLIQDIEIKNKAATQFTGFDVDKIREDFPILHQKVHGKPLVYLDNAATSQKPQSVINAVNKYYTSENSNIHRGVYYLSELATKEYENVRKLVKKFINANSTEEIIFVRSTTEAINLVATSYGKQKLNKGDEIIISAMEHHSNIVPWQMLCQEKGTVLKVIPINDDGEIIFEEFEKLLNNKTKFVSITHISNSLGTINPVKRIIKLAHQKNVPVLIDGAQAVPHQSIDIHDLDCDFYTFSGHKIFGPTGIGVLYGKKMLLEEMPPYQGGGDMIKSVTFEKTIYNNLPFKFEAGTPDIAGVIGLGAAIRYIQKIGYKNIALHENSLLKYATDKLSSIKKLRIIGTASIKASVISFDIDGIHPHDVGQLLDYEGIAVRTGHHCTQPVMDRFNVPATTRASFSFYNKLEEADKLVNGIGKVIRVFK